MPSGDVAPDQRDVAVVGVHERGAQRLHAARHRTRVAVQRARRGEHRDERVGIVLGEHARVEVVAAEPPRELGGRPERVFHRDLLVEQHPDQQRERVALQQRVGLRDPARAAAAQPEGSAGPCPAGSGRLAGRAAPSLPRRSEGAARGPDARPLHHRRRARAARRPARTPRSVAASPSPRTGRRRRRTRSACSSGCCCSGSVEPDAAVAAALAPLTPADAAAAGLLVPADRGRGLAGRARPAALRRGRRPGLVGALRPRRPPPAARPRHGRRGGLADARRRDRPAPGGLGARPRHRLRCAGPARDRGTHGGSPARTWRRERSRWPRPRSRSTTSTSSWWTGRGSRPVAGRRFDQIVSNPPFVPGPARVEFVYRDSGAGRGRGARGTGR